jgi:hypothetical protein
MITVMAGIAVDWAFFEKWKMTFQAFGDGNEVRYRDLPLPRFLLTVVSSAAIGFSLTPAGPLPFPFWAGIAIFLTSSGYAASRVLRR